MTETTEPVETAPVKYRVTLDLRESPDGAVAIYPAQGTDPKADLLIKSIAQNAGDKLATYEAATDGDLDELLTRTLKGVGVYHLYVDGQFAHYEDPIEVLSAVRGMTPPDVVSITDDANPPAQCAGVDAECIDALEAAVANCPPDEAICAANVIKYLWRYTDKDPVESLRKAQWYLGRLTTKVEKRLG